MAAVVTFDRVSKRYRLGTHHGSLRDAVATLASRWPPWRGYHNDTADYIWALQNVTFEVERGQVVGIVGHNGAGKTTLLKLLSGVTKPTSGRLAVTGRVSALIELGAGFHPDLTGRENIYLNGAILGLSRREIDRKFDRIVAFAELEKFIDTPVKRYSSGMYARLGFSVAAHTDPDLLLVDEVLGVGDTSFQQKCFDFIHSYVSGDKTALFVSHNLYVLEQLCDRLIWLDSGEIVRIGPPAAVLPAYFDSMEQRTLQQKALLAPQTSSLRITDVRFEDAKGVERDTFASGEAIIVVIHYEAETFIARPHFCLTIANPGGRQLLIGANMLVDGQAPASICGLGCIKCRFAALPLMPRAYELWGEVWHEDRTRPLVGWQRLGTFRLVEAETHKHRTGPVSVRHLRADAPVRVPYTWEY